MKKLILLSAMIGFTTTLFAQLQINPQIGINYMNFSDPPEGSDFEAKVGYSIGGDLRFGEKFQIQPGVHWLYSSTTVKVGDGAFEDTSNRQYIKLKALAAYNLIDKDGFKFRVNFGPAYDFLISAKSEGSDEDTKDDFNSGVFFLQGGIGVDILFMTADLGYAQGLTSIFDFENAPDSKTAGVYFTIGIILGDGKKD